MEAFWEDDEFESKLKEGILAQKKFKILYRFFLVVSGILLFLVGWIMWNIALPAEGESAKVGKNWETLLFFTGLLIQFIIGPFFAFISLSKNGRLSLLYPKEIREYYALKNSIRSKEIQEHYWAALKDPTHEHHNDVIRYKWMDKIQWKHRPHDFFGRIQFTKETGEVTDGHIVPKTSPAYINSNFTLDEKGNPVTTSPFTHPTRYLISIPNLLAVISLISLLPLLLSIALSGDISALEDVFGLIPIILFGVVYTIWRNTHLFDYLFQKENSDTMSVQVLEERLSNLRDKYLSIREHEEEQEAIVDRNLRRNEATKSKISPTSAIIILVSIATLWVGLDSNSLQFTLTFGFSLMAIGLLASKHFRLTQIALSFKGYRLSQDYIYLLDGIYSKKMKRKEIPEHSCVRIVDLYPSNTVRYYRGPNVCLHLIRLVRDEPDIFGNIGQQIIKPGFRLNGHDRIFFDGLGPRNEGVECWVEDIKIRFEFKTKVEQREFAERLASDLSLPIREHWRWSEEKKSNLFWVGSDWKSIPKNK